MRVLAVVHQDDAGPGVFGEAASARGATLEEWHPADQPAPPVTHDAVIVCGGAVNAHEKRANPWLSAEKELLRGLLADGVPVFGVCLGAQLLAESAGGAVRRGSEPEIGWRQVVMDPAAAADPVFGGLPDRFASFQWHSYEAVPPPGATELAHSAVCLQAFRLKGTAWGVQFHAEVTAAGAELWIRDYRSDPDAVRLGLDPDRLSAETLPAIGAWNDLGRDLCRRFLDVAYSGVT